MNVFITGATGFVGSHLCEKLLKENHKIYCLVRKSSNLKWLSKLNIELVYSDDQNKLNEYLLNSEIIYHIAGATNALCITKEDYFKGNFDITKTLLNNLVEINAKPKRFVYVSTLAACGPSKENIIMNEDTPENPVSWYGQSKLATEKLVKEYTKYFHVTIVRPPPVYGPRDVGMTKVFKAIDKGVIPILGNPTYTNFVFVEDLVNGIILAANSEKAVNETFYIASDENISSVEFLERISKSINKKTMTIKIPLNIIHFLALLSELKIQITKKPDIFNIQKFQELKENNWKISIDKAKKLLNYKPKISVEEGGLITYNWYKENNLI